jgi:cytochrome c553
MTLQRGFKGRWAIVMVAVPVVMFFSYWMSRGGYDSAGGDPFKSPLGAAERLVRSGEISDGQPVVAEISDGVAIQGKDAACASCHGVDLEGGSEGSARAPRLEGSMYNSPETLIRATNSGVNSEGRALSRIMPRYKLSESDAVGVLEYLRYSKTRVEPGVSESHIDIGVVASDQSLSENISGRWTEMFANTLIRGRSLRFVATSGADKNIEDRHFALVVLDKFTTRVSDWIPVLLWEARMGSGAGQNYFGLQYSHVDWLRLTERSLGMKLAPCGLNPEAASGGLYCAAERTSPDLLEFYSQWPPINGKREDVLPRLLIEALGRGGEPTRRSEFMSILRSGEAIDAGGKVVLRFKADRRVGLDGFFIHRGSGQAMEIIWRNF